MKPDFPVALHSRSVKRGAVIVVVALLLLYVLLPRIHAFGINGHVEMPKNIDYMFIGFSFFLTTFFISSISYSLLAFRRLNLLKVALIQFAGVPLSLLLPAGIGNISVNYLYLRTRGHSRVKAGLVVSANNLIGVSGNISMLLLLLAAFGVSASEWHTYVTRKLGFAIAALVLLLVIISIGLIIVGRTKRLGNLRKQLIAGITEYSKRPSNLVGAYMCAAAQAAVTALAFWFCLKAYGISLSFPSAFLVYSFSVMVGAIIPTPGGLGGVEASLVAGLVASHAASASLALAAVLAYRLLSYWLPLGLGFFALFVVERFKFIAWNQA